jgi:uncharacterized protein GlcG (DUF336 family)
MINRVPAERIYEARRQVFAVAERDGRQMAIAVADEAAQLVYGERMQDCAARVLTHAIRKAYTAATMRRDTLVFRDENVERGKSLADWGDQRLTQLQGGLVIRVGGEWHGAVAVGGHETEKDEELARLALRVLLGQAAGQTGGA